MAYHSSKVSSKNCGQTADNGDMVTIDSLQVVAVALYPTVPFSTPLPYVLSFSDNTLFFTNDNHIIHVRATTYLSRVKILRLR